MVPKTAKPHKSSGKTEKLQEKSGKTEKPKIQSSLLIQLILSNKMVGKKSTKPKNENENKASNRTDFQKNHAEKSRKTGKPRQKRGKSEGQITKKKLCQFVRKKLKINLKNL